MQDDKATADQQIAEDSLDSNEHISWQAYEHMPQQRSAKWFAGLIALTLVFMAIAVLVIRSWSFALVVAAAATALIVYTKRPPRTINYTVSPKGLYVDDELRPIENYKAFGVSRNGEQFTLVLLPTKRFLPGLTADFPESAGEKIVDILAARLPMQEIEPDVVDQLIRKLGL